MQSSSTSHVIVRGHHHTLVALSGAVRPAFSAFVALALTACGSPGGDPVISRMNQPILRGEVDEEHPAVMLLLNVEGFLCTGTLIGVEGQTGYLLTAAHCVTEASDGAALLAAESFRVVSGTDFAESATEFPVEALSAHPSYDGSFAVGDVAVVRFSFGDEPPPEPIPLLRSGEDELAIDDTLTLVGYGQTDTDADNTLRRRVERRVEALDPELVVYTQEDDKGACFGDSGGPVLTEFDGNEHVAAVISGGVDSDEQCSGGFGVAMRVSGHEVFIEQALDQGP